MPISKLHSILAVAILLAHNKISKICHCGQISLQSTVVNYNYYDNLTNLGVTLIILLELAIFFFNIRLYIFFTYYMYSFDFFFYNWV